VREKAVTVVVNSCFYTPQVSFILTTPLLCSAERSERCDMKVSEVKNLS